MQNDALQGGFADAPVEAAQAFRAVMNAMARPGRIEPLAIAGPPKPMSPAAGTVILTLCDPETPVYLGGGHDIPAIREWITFHTGAPIGAADQATFAVGEWPSLQPLDRFAIGTSEYPDRSATLIVETEILRPEGARLTGPGIKVASLLSLPDLAPFQQNAALFPLGLDFFFTAGDCVAALPRTTNVEGL